MLVHREAFKQFLSSSARSFTRNDMESCPIAAFLESQLSKKIEVASETYKINDGSDLLYNLPVWATIFIEVIDECNGSITSQECLTILDQI